MLFSRHRQLNQYNESTNIHNYYERLVTEVLAATNERATTDADFQADVSCVALNHLPPRYIRHDVDMSFFMSPIELEETMQKVTTAVEQAIAFVLSRETPATIENTEPNTSTDAKH